MKINFLQISNILSFKHYHNLVDIPKISFDKDLNILIGQNGAGKSTVLEVINFLFKRVLFKPAYVDQGRFQRRLEFNRQDQRSVISRPNTNNYKEFRLNPNWNTENESQTIVLEITLEDIDLQNIAFLKLHRDKIVEIADIYSGEPIPDFDPPGITTIQFTVTFDVQNRTFSAATTGSGSESNYLINYNLYRQLIDLHNWTNPADQIQNLIDTFSLLSGYRNYNAFSPSVNLQSSSAQQIQEIRLRESNMSMNSTDGGEPGIFGLVRLKIAEKHFNLLSGKKDNAESEQEANNEPFLISINEKLSIVNLKVEIKLTEQRTWSYSFQFIDIKRNKPIYDINSLSAGQKSIIHLVFEAYGKGELQGGVIIIDEPEIHLHHQFQDEYLRIVQKLNREQNCQYILVTHSESFINSDTIGTVTRFALDANNNTIIKKPTISADIRTLVKILDNTRSVYALFASKVVLVEGDTDRYFFRSVLSSLYPELNQSIAVLSLQGKGSYEKWRQFFEEFGVSVYFIGDFDNVFTVKFSGITLITSTEKSRYETELRQLKLTNLTAPNRATLQQRYTNLSTGTNFDSFPSWQTLTDFFKQQTKLSNSDVVTKTRQERNDIDTVIVSKYTDKVFILKKGAIEEYTHTSHGKVDEMAVFCDNLSTWLQGTNDEVQEIKTIIQNIVA
jgi:predicted ATP-dependent endonuclease of OLD family